MREYLDSVFLWATGFRRLDTLTYRKRWTARSFLWLYAIDYGIACVMLGMGVQPISRWAYDRRDHEPWTTLNRWLDAVDTDHGKDSGGLLWGSKPLRARNRYVLIGAWVLIVAAIVIWW
jgi:hypothetical protein